MTFLNYLKNILIFKKPHAAFESQASDKENVTHKNTNKALDETLLNTEVINYEIHAIENWDGAKLWLENDTLHRLNGPAIESPDGSHEWWIHGKIQKIENHEKYPDDDNYLFIKDGKVNFIEWYNGVLWDMRDIPVLPAIRGPSTRPMHPCLKEFKENGVLHRVDGPARIGTGYKAWYTHGRLHREDGPAVVQIAFPHEKNFPGKKFYYPRKQWFKDNQLHRESGPAVELGNGTKKWYLYGRLHREDGPAIEKTNGSAYWYLKGKLHRIDGPAVILPQKSEFWLNGRQYDKIEYALELEKLKKKAKKKI